MAIVDLGTLTFPVGGGQQTFQPFPYRDNRAYAMFFTISAATPTNIFSYLRMEPFVFRDNGSDIYYHEFTDIDILKSPRIILLPFSNVYDSNGDCEIRMERLPFIRGTGDEGDVVVNLTYDDDTDIRSWL